jgi:hypothetical protein
VIAFLLITLLLNPAFLNTGINTLWKIFEVRSSAFYTFQQTYPNQALLSVVDRFEYAMRIIFLKSGLFYSLIKIPVEFFLFGIGIYYVVKRRDLFLLFVFLFLVIIPISLLPFRMPRYLYWVSPFIYIIAGLSSNLFKDIVSKKTLDRLKTIMGRLT